MEPTHTPHRPIRVSDDLWEAFGLLVGSRNRARVVREFIAWYVRAPGAKLPKRQPVTAAPPSDAPRT